MRIAAFSPTIDITNGYGNITFELLSAMAQKGIDITLFLPNAEEGLVASMDVPFRVRPELPKPVLQALQKPFWQYFRSYDVAGFDLVHSLFAFPFCIPALRSAKRAGLPFMMGAQGTYGVLPLTRYPDRWLLRHCYTQADRIAVPSAFTRDKIREYAKVEYPIDVIHNGVRFERFQAPQDTQRIRSQFGNKKILMTVGGLKSRKGQDIVLRALPAVFQKHPDTVYVLVGEGSWKAHLQSVADELGIAERVVFVGNKTGEELVAHFQACDVYVHTPRVDKLNFEGFGIVYLEAGACGKPSVATDAGGIRDAVVDGKTGLVVADEDIDAVAQSIITLLDNPDQIRSMGEHSREYAAQHDWSKIADQFISVYSSLLPSTPLRAG